MAEFAGAIVGLIQVAEHVGLKIFRYVKHVSQAEKEVRQLSATLASLVGTLHGIELAIRELDQHQKDHVLQSADVVACKTIITQLNVKLSVFVDKAQAGQTTQALQVRKKWKWPFTIPETVELNLKLESHKSALNLTLATDNLTALLRLSASHESLQKRLQKIEVGLEARARIKMTKRREETLRRLYPKSPLHHHQTNRRLRHSGTGDWFIQSTEFQDWLANRNGKLWVHGIPGAGKTVLAAYAIDQVLEKKIDECSRSECAIAYFYCDYKDTMTQTPLSVLGSIVQQIARQHEQSFMEFEKFVAHSSSDRQTGALSYQCDDLCRLLSTMAVNFAEIIIIVDGLDECEGLTAEVSAYLARIAHDTLQFRVLLFSRHIVEVSRQLEDFNEVSIAAQSSDLLIYVGEQIRMRADPKSLNPLRTRDSELKGEILDTLVNKAEGMFRWVALQIDYICGLPTDKAIREALNTLPLDLFASYERLLVQLNKKPRPVRQLFERAIKWILRSAMSTQAVCEAVAIEPGMAEIDLTAVPDKFEILRHCGSFVRESFDGKYLEFAHFTVKEFFYAIDIVKTPELAAYRFETKELWTFYASSALTYLCIYYSSNSAAELISLEASQSYSTFRSIATHNWFAWVRRCPNEPIIDDLTKKLFTHYDGSILRAWSLEFMASNKCQLPEHSLPRHETFVPLYSRDELVHIANSLSPLHNAALLTLPETCHWLIQQGHLTTSLSPLRSPLFCALLGPASLSFWNQKISRRSYQPEHDGGILVSVIYPLVKPDFEKLKQVLQTLVESGASIDDRQCLVRDERTSVSLLDIAINMAHMTIYDLVCMRSWLDVVEYLISLGATFSHNNSFELLIGALTRSVARHKTSNLHRVLLQKLSLADLDKDKRQNLETFMKTWRSTNPLTASPENIPQNSITTTLHTNTALSVWFDAAKYNYLEVVTRFVASQAIDIDVQDCDGHSALHLAAKWSSIDVARFLIDNGANVNLITRMGTTPLIEALSMATADFVQHLIANGADCTAVTYSGQNMWHTAAKNLKAIPWQKLQLLPPAVRALASNTDSEGQTPLAVAASFANVDAFFSLWDMEVDEFAVDTNGRNLLHHAARGGSFRLVEFLIARGHSVAVQDDAGYNALLHAASQKPQTESLISCQKLLFQTDCDCTLAVTREKQTIESFILENVALAHKTRLDNVDWSFLQTLLMRKAGFALNLLIKSIPRTAGLESRTINLNGFDHIYDKYPAWTVKQNLDQDFGRDLAPAIAWDQDQSTDADAYEEYISEDDEVEVLEPEADSALDVKHPNVRKMIHGPWANLANIFEVCTQSFFIENQHLLGRLLETLLSQDNLVFQSDARAHLVRLVCKVIDGLDKSVLQSLRWSDYSFRGSSKRQLLNGALSTGYCELQSCLLAKKLDVDAFDHDTATDKRNAVQIVCADSTCSLAIFKAVIGASKNLRLVTKNGEGLLHLAASSENTRFRLAKMNHLLEVGLRVDLQSCREETALHAASYRGIAPAVQLLLEKGADPSLKNSSGWTPAHCAASRGQVKVLSQLSSEKVSWNHTCDLNYRSASNTYDRIARGVSLLHLAAACGSVKTITFLLGFPDIFDANGMPEQDLSPLQLAVWNGNYRAAAFLLTSGAKFTSLPYRGLSLLHVAASRGNTSLVSLLLKHGHESSVTDTKGLTPLDYAIRGGFTKVVKLIAGNKPEIRPRDMTHLKHELCLAIECGDLEACEKSILEGVSLEEPCDLKTRLTPVLYALYHGENKIAEYLLKAGAPCDAITPEHLTTYGYTALHYCVISRDKDLLDMVLDACPDLLFLATYIHPVHLAIINGDEHSLHTMLTRLSGCWKKSRRPYLPIHVDDGRHLGGNSIIEQSPAPKLGKIPLVSDPLMVTNLPIKSRLPSGTAKHRLTAFEGDSDVGILSDNHMSPQATSRQYTAHDIFARDTEKYNGLRPLHCAVQVGSLRAVELLLAHGASLKSLSSDATTPLSKAITSGSDVITLALLNGGASMYEYDFRGYSNIELATQRETQVVLDKVGLVRHDTCNPDVEGSNMVAKYAMGNFPNALIRLRIDEKSLTTPDNFGESAIQRCIREGPQPMMFCYIVNAGFDLSGSTTAFGSVVNVFWKDEKCSMLKRLLRRLGIKKSTALLNTKPEYRQTPLYNAAVMGQHQILKHLLTYPVDLDMWGGPLGSALMAGASYGRLEAVQILINAGASVTIRSPEDDSLMSVYTQAKHFPEIQQWLLVDRFTQTRYLTHVDSERGQEATANMRRLPVLLSRELESQSQAIFEEI